MNEEKDSLRSKATLSILDLLGEGPIGGLVSGAKSVFLNDTPLQNENGTANFQGVTWDIRGGGNTQSVMPGFGNYVESPYSAGVQVKQNTPYTLSINNPNADAVRIVVSIPGLTTTNGSNGNITGATVQYKFQVSTDSGATWVDQFTDYAWGDLGSWAVENGDLTANAPSSAYYGIQATVQATCSALEYGTITVQPQEFNGSSWQNLGAAFALTHSVVEEWSGGDNTQSVVMGESRTVQSNYNKVRFVVTSQTSVSSSIVAGTLRSRLLTQMATVSGKSRSRYQRSHVIRVAPGSTTRVRMVRITPDSTSALLQNDTYIDSYSEIVSLNMEYPNSAIFGLRVDSQQFGGQIPNRSYLLDGLYIRVPVNYDPVARSYSGVWNGTFKYAISNNPAWVMFDVLTHKRYGLGNFIEDAQVDKAALYTIGKYCDEQIPDGFGGMEPRFTLNTVIANLGEAYKLVSDIASVFRGMGFWDGGMVNFMQDSPADPVMLYTSANVINGEFAYSGSARKDRHSVAYVTWNDPSDNYKQRVEYVEDAELVSLYGVRKIDTLAFGCTSRGQAARVGKWILYTEKYESDLITFKVGLDSAFVMPGNIVKIHDANRAGRRSAGRLTSWTTTSATLDSATTLTGASTISIMMPDGTFADRQVSQAPGTYTVLTWQTPLTQSPVDNAVWMLSEANLLPVLARIIGVTQGENPGEFDITALEHNPSKFDAIEQGWELEDRKTSIIDASFVQTPTKLYVTDARYKVAPGVFANKLLIFWYGDSTQYDVAYRGVSDGNRSNWITTRVTDGLSQEVENVAAGTYEFSIVGINPLGKRSASATGTYTVVGKVTPPSDVAQFFATANAQGVELSWVPIADEDVKSYEVRACSTAGQSWNAATKLIDTPLTVYQLPPAAAGTYEWLIKAIDTSGNYSTNARRVSVTLAAPSAVTPTYSYSRADIVLSWNAATAGSLPVKHYILKRGSTWASAVVIGTTTDLTYKTPVKWSTTQLIWVAAVDIANSVGAPTSVSAVFAAPVALTLSDSRKSTNYILAWATPTSTLPIASYEVRYGSSFANGVVVGSISGNQLTIPITWFGSRTFWVAAIDLNGNVGAAASRELAVIAPRAPTNFAARYNQGQVTINWADSAETLPIDFYEIRRGADWDAGELVGKAYTNTLTLEVSWTESATFTARATDLNGNEGEIGTYVNGITAPGVVSVAHQFKDGNAILTWAAPTGGSLPIRYYEVREGATWATASLVGVTSDRLYSIPVNWTSSKSFFVAAVDTAGNFGTAGSRDVTFISYDAPTGLTAAISQANVTLSWQSAANGSLDIAYYDIRFGNDWDTGEVIGKSNTTTITLPITWVGARRLWVTAVDTNKQYGASASVDTAVTAPSAPAVSSTIVVAKVELTWTAPGSTLPIKEYEIRYGSTWATGAVVATTFSTTYRAPIEWLGDRTYWIAARDVNGNVGAADSTVVTVTAPVAPSVAGGFVLDEFKLTWSAPNSALPIAEYEIRHGDSWAAGTVLGRVKGTTISTKAKWIGSRNWWVAAIDLNGNVGAAGTAALVITAPSAPSMTQQVVDNNVLLYWTQSTGTLPVVTYELRRGDAWDTGSSIGQKAGGFTTIFETISGTYTYWVAGIDSASNVGVPGKLTATVNQPPDYKLLADNDLSFSGTRSNMHLDTDGTYIMPVNVTETFEQHFTRSGALNDDVYESASWVKTRCSVTAGALNVESAGWSADKLACDATAATTHYISQTSTMSVAVGQVYSYAIRAKASEYDEIYVQLQGGTGRPQTASVGANLNLTTGVVSLVSAGVTTQVTSLGGGEYEFRISTTATQAGTARPLLYVASSTGASTGRATIASPTAGSGIYIWKGRTFLGTTTPTFWTSPNAQIASGFPIFIQPAAQNGYYEEVIDYGTAIGGTKITVTPTGTVVAGAPTTTVSISVKLNSGDAWTDYNGVSSVFVNNFRYTKIRLTVSGDDLSLYRLSKLNVKLDTKIRNEANMGMAGAADAVSGANATVNGVSLTGVNPTNSFGNRVPDGAGTMVRFDTSFVDITAIEISLAAGTTARYALYDFVDTPNPAGFKVLLYDGSGNRVGGTFSWSVKGY